MLKNPVHANAGKNDSCFNVFFLFFHLYKFLFLVLFLLWTVFVFSSFNIVFFFSCSKINANKSLCEENRTRLQNLIKLKKGETKNNIKECLSSTQILKHRNKYSERKKKLNEIFSCYLLITCINLSPMCIINSKRSSIQFLLFFVVVCVPVSVSMSPSSLYSNVS